MKLILNLLCGILCFWATMKTNNPHALISLFALGTWCILECAAIIYDALELE